MTQRLIPSVARSPDKSSRAGDDRRQKLWRELALVAVAPLLFYLFVSLGTYSTDDPGWSRTGSVAGALHNVGGLVGLGFSGLLANATSIPFTWVMVGGLLVVTSAFFKRHNGQS